MPPHAGAHGKVLYADSDDGSSVATKETVEPVVEQFDAKLYVDKCSPDSAKLAFFLAQCGRYYDVTCCAEI